MNTHPTLEQRIAIALQPDTAITSADLAALMEEAVAGIAEADQERMIDQTLSLDPTAARQAIADATFAANRFRTLLSKLQARCQQVRDEEERTAWLAEVDALKPKRDALAEELREVYTDAATKIVDLFVRITENDKALSERLRDPPAGVTGRPLSAELHARRLDGFSINMPSLLTAVHLVDLDTGREIWPPPQPSLAAACAATVLADYGPRYTGDWAKDNERRAAAQRAEQQRHADYLARQTEEARERFFASQHKNSV
jgi:hypothetical protein